MTEYPDVADARPSEERRLRAYLAGIDQPDAGPATLWLSDESTTMHFPLTEATVPALLGQLEQLAADYGPRPQVVAEPYRVEEDDDPVDEPEPPGRLARWTGWHYSNAMVSRIPPHQRVALFAAVLVILLFITLFTGH